jgi:DNA-binding NarL/FixJ family response regulator
LIRITIIAPAIAIRAGLRALLSEDPQIQVVGEAEKPSEIDEILPDSDVLVWSPGSLVDQVEAFADLKKVIKETTAILVLHDDPEEVRSIKELKVRAWGILDPESTQAELLASIQALIEGLVVASPAWINRIYAVGEARTRRSGEEIEPLTNRELEILQLLALGLTNKQIAARLKISAHTVKFHLSIIFNKMATTNRLETVKLGLQNGLIAL